MSIIVCNLEVPMCWIEYRKAGKSLWEIIFFLFVKKISKAPSYPQGPISFVFFFFFVQLVVLSTNSTVIDGVVLLRMYNL